MIHIFTSAAYWIQLRTKSPFIFLRAYQFVFIIPSFRPPSTELLSSLRLKTLISQFRGISSKSVRTVLALVLPSIERWAFHLYTCALKYLLRSLIDINPKRDINPPHQTHFLFRIFRHVRRCERSFWIIPFWWQSLGYDCVWCVKLLDSPGSLRHNGAN